MFRKRTSSGISETESLGAAGDLDKQLVLQLAPSRIPSARQFKYMSRLLTNREQAVIRLSALLVIASLVVLGVRFVQRHIKTEPRVGGEYTEALVGSPNRINPLYAAANDVDRDLATLVYSSLFTQDAAKGIQPSLAQSYELTGDDKIYIVKLRPDAVWQDGRPITADDVLFTFESIQNPEYQSPLSVSFRGVTIERVDDYSVKFILSEPFAPFIGALTFGVLPQHVWGEIPPLNVGLVEYNLKPIGSGPYKFDHLTRDRLGNMKSYHLVRNDRYFGSPAYIEKLNFRFFQDFESAISAVKNKKIDGISYVPDESKAELRTVRGLTLTRLNLLQYTAIFFNEKRGEIIKDRSVREALVRATDSIQIIQEVLAGDGVPVHGPILPGIFGFNPEMKTYSYDPEQAKKLLDDAGWKLPEGGTIRTKGETELKIVVATSGLPTYQKTLDLLTHNWAAVGIKLESQLVEPSRIQADIIKTRDYDALLYGEVVGFDPDPYPFWHSSQQKDPGLSLSIFYSKEADKSLESARTKTSPEERALKYIEFQNIIADNVPALFLYQPTYTYGLAKKVKGNPTTLIEVPSDRFSKIADWYIKTKKSWK